MDWIGHIRDHTSALAAAASEARLDTPVLTCPGWTLADLVWHVLEVQDFWGHIIEHRPDGPDGYDEPARPSDDQLVPGLLAARDRLVGLLEAAGADEAAWSWSQDHTVGFTLRRQAHEAFVHLVDGLFSLDRQVPEIDPAFAADGVDEIVTIMLAGGQPGAKLEPGARTLLLRGTDVAREWTLRHGHLGTRAAASDSSSGDDSPIWIAESGRTNDPDADVSGRAVELDLWLWGRTTSDRLSVEGDRALVAALGRATQVS